MRFPILLALLALAVAPAAAQRSGAAPPACTPPPGTLDELPALRPGARLLAVLAFSTPSGDQARHDLAAAIGERVSARLRALRPREIISRAGRGGDIANAVNGRSGADARYLLSATLEPGGEVSFVVRLLDGRTGREVWRGRIAREGSRLHEVEGAIAAAVASRTLRGLSREQQRALVTPPTQSATAYARFIEGLEAMDGSGRAEVQRGLEAFDAAWRADPGFVDAWVRLAMAYARLLEINGLAETDVEAMSIAALTAADRALALDPGRSDAWVVRAALLERANPRTLAGARDAYERALAVDPDNSEAHRRLGRLLARIGEHDRAATHLRSALFLEPESGRALTDLAELRLTQGRHAEACLLLNAALDAEPGAIDSYILRVLARIPLHEYRAAWADAETAARLGSPTQGEAVSVLVDLAADDTVSARRRVRQLARRPNVASSSALSVREAELLAFAFGAMGERALAMRALDRARPRGAGLWYAMQHPRMGPIRELPEFRRLLAAASPLEEQP
jgi:tetratricopeptide (TPR) repeat protein